jgi:hypothetical protein
MHKKIALIAILVGPMALPPVAAQSPGSCIWVDDDLETGLYGPKDFWGDTNNAYAGFVIPSGSDYIYRIEGQFPNSRFMSLESAVFLEDLDAPSAAVFGVAGLLEDFDDVIDQTVIPDEGSTNPFTPGTTLDFDELGDRYFTIDVVPEGIEWEGSPNQLTYPSGAANSEDGRAVLVSFRAYSPNKGVTGREFARDELPTITLFNRDGQPINTDEFPPNPRSLIGCGNSQWARDLGAAAETDGDADPPELGSVESLLSAIDYSSIDGFITSLRLARGLFEVANTNFEKWWQFSFRLVDIPFEGNAGIPGYLYGLTQMTPGKVAVIRFKAPSFLNTYAGEAPEFSDSYDLRFWSMCVLDFWKGEALACMADHMTNRFANRGYATMVYGPERVRAKAESLGYVFVEDRRDNLSGEWDDKALAFVYRRLLPSPAFQLKSLVDNDYVPKARVCSERQFLLGWCNIRFW